MTKIAAHSAIHTHDDHDHDDHPHDHGDHSHDHSHEHDYTHDEHQHGILETIASALHLPGHHHEHGNTDVSLLNNEEGIQAVKWALVILGITTLLQTLVYLQSGSVALLGDTVHNLGDALNSIPLWIAFLLARRPPNKRYTYGYGRSEDIAGVIVVISIGFSALYILSESIQKLQHPQTPTHLLWVAAASVIGFIGNEAVALLRIRVGRQIDSAALVADGLHARADGLTSLSVLVAAGGTALGFPILDAIIGILMGILILFITRDAAISMWYRLMDAVDPQLIEQAEAKIREHEEIKAIHALQLRYVGHQLRGELLLGVESTLTVAESETVIDHIRHELYHLLPALADVTIGILPEQTFYQESGHHHHVQ